MIIATFTPEPTTPPVITNSSGTRYAQMPSLQSMVDSFEHWRQEQARKQAVQNAYNKCAKTVKRESVLGGWDADTQSYQLETRCGNDPSKPPTITIIRG
jgi:hypothetical protein